jgi:Mg-chelatase subunit ChlD
MQTHFLSSAVLCAAFLFLPSCDRREAVEVSAQAEAAAPPAAKETRPNDFEPVPGITHPGSRMDPSSNAYIILDGSGSMAGEPISEAKRAVSSFVRAAPEDLNIGLFVFDQDRQRGKELVPLGRGQAQRGELLKAIQGVQAGGGTPLGAALRAGTDALVTRFQMQLRYGDIRLIVVTDGEASDPREFDSSIRHARGNHVPVYTIGFRMRNNHPLRQYSEAYLTAHDEQQLLDAMKQTLAELDDNADL